MDAAGPKEHFSESTEDDRNLNDRVVLLLFFQKIKEEEDDDRNLVAFQVQTEGLMPEHRSLQVWLCLDHLTKSFEKEILLIWSIK